MIALKIIGIVLAIILLLIFLLLISRIRLIISYTRENGFLMAIKVWGIKFNIKSKSKKKKSLTLNKRLLLITCSRIFLKVNSKNLTSLLRLTFKVALKQ